MWVSLKRRNRHPEAPGRAELGGTEPQSGLTLGAASVAEHVAVEATQVTESHPQGAPRPDYRHTDLP